jgi:hypothetical protein
VTSRDVLDEGLAARAELVERITAQLATLEFHHGMGIAVGVVIKLFKEKKPEATRAVFLKMVADCWDRRDDP